MQILKLENESGGGEYLLVPCRLVKWMVWCTFIIFILTFLWVMYQYVYLPSYASYYVTRNSSVLHNRACVFFGNTKGFYTNKTNGWKNCKVCGGRQQFYNVPSDLNKK